MRDLYLSYGTLYTPLGTSIQENFENISKGRSGVSLVKESGFGKEDYHLGKIENLNPVNRYQDLLARVCKQLVDTQSTLCKSQDTIVILSSTKADIKELPDDTFESSRSILRNILGIKNDPIIISNACISGVLAINTAADYLDAGKYKNAIIIGIDALSDFIVYGFQSLFALSNEPSRPFDQARKGISIGEACGAVILSTEFPNNEFAVQYLGGSSSNDANHISGPSRTGEGLFRSVNKTLSRAGITKDQIDYISAHGTGTLYNDEMESIAFDRLGLSQVPSNSLKGYFGHTLGAAGIIEVIIAMMSMEHQTLFKSMGFEEQGTSKPMNIIKNTAPSEIKTVLKTASGFGGGNASLILKSLS